LRRSCFKNPPFPRRRITRSVGTEPGVSRLKLMHTPRLLLLFEYFRIFRSEHDPPSPTFAPLLFLQPFVEIHIGQIQTFFPRTSFLKGRTLKDFLLPFCSLFRPPGPRNRRWTFLLFSLFLLLQGLPPYMNIPSFFFLF